MIHQRKKEWEGATVLNFSNWFQKGQEDCLILLTRHRVLECSEYKYKRHVFGTFWPLSAC
jgi:hypothetical protein